MIDPSLQSEVLLLIEALIDGTIDDAGFARLDALLQESAFARAIYRRYMNLHAALPALIGSVPQLSIKLSDQPGDQITDTCPVSDGEFIRLLLELEDSGHSIDLVDATELFTQHERPSLSRHWIYGGIAAALLVALSVFLIVQGMQSGQVPQPITAGVDPAKQPMGRIAVATLTAEHDARWVQGAFATGERLYAGQRLSLTRGFAKITTNAGAVAIIEAPSTIELINNENAIRLQTGKLVGICETSSSLGFTVYTPGGRIIDTGTRFGVIYNGATSVRVMDGEVLVKASRADAGARLMPLSVGETARITADRSAVIVGPIEDSRFVTQWGAVKNGLQLDGVIVFEPAMPIALGTNQNEADLIQVYLERSGLTLAEDAVVTLTEPGAYGKYEGLAERVAAGQLVDSYFVHLDPHGNENAAAGFHATIQFDRPILGIIATGEHLMQSNKALGLAGVTYGSANAVLSWDGKDPSGIEASAANPSESDRIRLSEDRRTLTLELYCGIAIDQLRVLVASEQETR